MGRAWKSPISWQQSQSFSSSCCLWSSSASRAHPNWGCSTRTVGFSPAGSPLLAGKLLLFLLAAPANPPWCSQASGSMEQSRTGARRWAQPMECGKKEQDGAGATHSKAQKENIPVLAVQDPSRTDHILFAIAPSPARICYLTTAAGTKPNSY